MYTIRNFFSNSREKNPESSIFFKIEGDFYFLLVPILPFFTKEEFSFTLEKTFSKYEVIICELQDIYQIKISKGSHKISEIISYFYSFIYKHWAYY